MQAIQVPQVIDAIQKLSGDKLRMVYDFIQYLAEAEHRQRHLKPPAVVFIPAEEYEELQCYRRLAALQSFAQEFGREVEQHGLTEEAFLADVKKTRHELFQEKYGTLR
jgi:hypothetical protein